MLMANLKAVLTRPKVSENYARNAFDRSFSPKLSYQVGALQPFMAEQCIAGSHIKLNRSIFQRTAAVNTAAFPKVDTHCEFFYVPLRLLWSYWSDYKLKIQDYNSSNLGSFNSTGVFTPNNSPLVPTFDLNAVRDSILSKIAATPYTPTGPAYFTTKRTAVEADRLLDALGYGYVKGTETRIADDDYVSFTVNAFKLMAYQKVYYDHFRNTSYESNDPSYYNWDAWAATPPPYQIVSKLFSYRYVNYRRDYFTSLFPALNYVVSSPSGGAWVVPNSVLFALNPNGVSAEISFSTNAGGQTYMRSPFSSAGNTAVTSVQQIRAAFALDKLLRATSYAPKHVSDQFEARYGVKGIESGNESVRIGAMMNDIIFQEVTNTAANLGDIGGKGVGHAPMEKDIEFTCKEDCIILGLMYSLPRTSYDSLRVRNWNMKIAGEDFFIPEYMNLGMQPLLHGELQYEHGDMTANNLILGYQNRYIEYKSGIDVNHGLFNNGLLLSDFVVHSGQGRSFTGSGVTSSYFKVNPRDMDSIFAQATATDDPTTDKFYTYMDVKFICNQNMSVHGQPVNIGS